MISLYPDSITGTAFVVVIVLGLAAYCRLVWAERDRDHTRTHAPGATGSRQCEVTYCRTPAVAVVHSRRGTLRVCRDCAEFLCSDAGGYEEVT